MSGPNRTSLFLARASYRQRRLRDAARMLPVIGVILWMIPLLWRADEATARGTGTAMVYIFVIWCLVIVAAGLIAVRMKPDETAGTPPPPGEEGG